MLVAVGHGLLVGERLDRILFRIVGRAQQEARYGQRHVAGILGLAEALPLGELRAFEMILQVLQVRQAGEAFQAEELRTGGRHEWRMGHAGHAGDVLHQLDVGRTGRHVVVGDDGADRLATELAVFGGVDVLVQAGLHHLGRVLEIVQQVLLGNAENLDLDVLAEVGAVDQQLQAAPGRLQRLEIGMMENLVHLRAELGVDLGDHPVDHRLLHRLDEGGDATLGDVVGLVVRAQAGLGDDAVENVVFAVLVPALLCGTGAHVSASLARGWLRRPGRGRRSAPARPAHGYGTRRRRVRFRWPCGTPGRCPAGP